MVAMENNCIKARDNSLDLLKLFAIVSVILIHTGSKTSFFGIFWYAQAVPVFMVLLGYNCKYKLMWGGVKHTFLISLYFYFLSYCLCC